MSDVKKFSLNCEGYEQPKRYSDFESYPIFYHPCTIDGEAKGERYNKGSVAWKTPDNLGFYGYTGDWMDEDPDITISDFTWPISGDFRFTLLSKLFPHSEFHLMDVSIPLAPGEFQKLSLTIKRKSSGAIWLESKHVDADG
jgi:hypothetical protein